MEDMLSDATFSAGEHASVNGGEEVNDDKCFFCQQYNVCKSQVYGPCRASDFKACRKDASNSKAGKATFNLLLQKKDADLRRCLQECKTKCGSLGRGKSRKLLNGANSR